MIYISEENYLSRFPKNDLFFENLDDDSKKVFLTRYSVYMNFLYDYLINKTSIMKYDNNFKNHTEFNYPSIDDDNKDLYQFMANGKLNYYYVRNNIDLNRLSEEEIKFLDGRISNNDFSYTKEVEDFIESTLEKVISFSDDENVLMNYGPENTTSFFAKNGMLVIGGRFDEYTDMDLKNYDNQMKYFRRQNLALKNHEDLKNALLKELPVRVCVFNYVQQNVKSLKDNNDIVKQI